MGQVYGKNRHRPSLKLMPPHHTLLVMPIPPVSTCTSVAPTVFKDG